MATEMVLVPKAAYERLTMSDNTVEVRGNSHDEEKKKVVDNASEKKEVSHLDIDNAESSSSPHPQSSGNSEGGAGQVIQDSVPLSIVEQFPPRYRLYAKRLLAYIKKHGGKVMTWNDDDNALMYKDSKVDGSNIVELIMHVFKTNRKPPVGIQQFTKGSDKIKVPKSFLKPYMLNPPGMPKSIKNKWLKY